MQINARDWKFQVSPNPNAGTPVWTDVAGIESFTLSPSEGEETTDTTTFASSGTAESQVMQRGASLELAGKLIRANTTPFAQDAGQLACDTLAAQVGEASLGGVRFRYTSDTTWTQWTAWASPSDKSGGINDKTSWGATFTRSGAATTPAAP